MKVALVVIRSRGRRTRSFLMAMMSSTSVEESELASLHKPSL